MKLIVGILLVAVSAVLSYPLGNEELKDQAIQQGLPLVIADYSSVAKAKEQPAQDTKPADQSSESGSSSSSSSSSEESSERPASGSEALIIPSTTELIEEIKPSSEELVASSIENKKPLSDEKPILLEDAEKPAISTEPSLIIPIKQEEQKREEKKEEPKPILPETLLAKEEEKIQEVVSEAIKPSSELKLRKDETIQVQEIITPAVKSILEGAGDVVQVAKQTPSVAEESIQLPAAAAAAAPSVLKPEIPQVEPVASATTQEKIEKPLALPTLKATELEAAAPAPAIPETIKETPIIAEEKVLEVVANKPQEEPVAAVAEEKKPVELEPVLAVEKNEKKAKAEEAGAADATSLPALTSSTTSEQPKAELSSTLPPQQQLSSTTTIEPQLPESSSPSSPSS